jgi:dTDP-glucose pyrophosphorylase
MEYLLERMVVAGADSIRVAVRPEKTDVSAFASSFGAVVVRGHPRSVSESLLLAASGLDDDDIVLFGFPDTIWTPVDGFVPLTEMVNKGEPLALGVFESPYPERSDVAILGSDGRIVRIDVKPDRADSELVWACGVTRLAAIRELLHESEPGRCFSQWAKTSSIAAARLGRVLDIGTPAGLEAAERDRMFGNM